MVEAEEEAAVMSENIQLMRLVHELKARFPAVRDEFVKGCVLKYGKNYSCCVSALQAEAERTSSRGHLTRRRQSVSSVRNAAAPHDRSKRRRFSDLGLILSEPAPLPDWEGRPVAATSPTPDPVPRVVLTAGEGAALEESGETPRTLFCPGEEGKLASDDLVLLGCATRLTAVCLDVVEASPSAGEEGLEESEGADRDSAGGSSSITTASPSSPFSGGCSLSTATLSHGEIRVVASDAVLATTAFTTLSTTSVASTAGSPGSSPVVTRTTTSSTVLRSNPHQHSNQCPENPFKKVFARRKEFYQSIAARESKVSSVNRLLLRKRHCALCCARDRSCCSSSGGCPNERHHRDCSNVATQSEGSNAATRITLDADIRPFLPFTIRHDAAGCGPPMTTAATVPELTVKGAGAASCSLRQTASASDLPGLTVCPEGGLRYAASAINSEDGLESHLEVSVGVDGSSVITTRHKRVGSPSEISNNSVVQVRYDEDGGKVVSIRHTQHKNTPVPPSARVPSAKTETVPAGLCLPFVEGGQRSSSAYCTLQVAPASFLPGGAAAAAADPFFDYPRFNSLPNLNGRRPGPVNAVGEGGHAMDDNGGGAHFRGYISHPADEEKRLRYTRALLAHQMEQRIKLETELHRERENLEALGETVRGLEAKVRHKDMFRLKLGASSNKGNVDTIIDAFAKEELALAALEKDIEELQRSCDHMAGEISNLTKGKGLPVSWRPPSPVGLSEALSWPCPVCAFLNHPVLDSCEECRTPRGNSKSSSNDCFCNPLAVQSS